MREKADEEGVDLLLVDTGDRIEGNGLYDASRPKGEFTYDIFREQHMDIITIGNHELYQADAAAREYEQTVPNFKESYIASNLDYIEPSSGKQVPMAQRYRKFTTENQGIRVLAFGFLFNFNRNANNTVVQSVEETIKKDWFQQAIREDVDLFVIAGHVMLESAEYNAIFSAIRSQNWDIPIQFFGGHSHIRNFRKYDAKSYGLQSGRYMETIGWLSMEGVEGKGKKASEAAYASKAGISVKRRYIDNNLFGFHHHTGLDHSTFPTDHGQNVSASINDARISLKLDQNYGCAPRDLWLSRTKYPREDSMLSWLSDEVVPDVVTKKNRADIPRIALVNSGTLRFDIYKGPFTRDTTYIVSPFRSNFLYISDVPFASAQKVNFLINQDQPFLSDIELDMSHAKAQSDGSSRAQFNSEHRNPASFDRAQSPIVQSFGDNKHRAEPDLVSGYTTVDDAGKDGDDTIHSPIQFYNVPNCVETRLDFPKEEDPETVDLVFIDFIQPWVLLALKFLGEQYTEEDVEVYTEETLTELMTGWIGRNWKQDC